MQVVRTKILMFCILITLFLAVITVMLYKQDSSEVLLMSKRVTNETELRNLTKVVKKDTNTTNSSYRPAPQGNALNITFPQLYHATGVITLPYDGIMEPFEAWYASQYNMSRIDYYYGADKTFQRGDLLNYGVYIKEIPVHKQKKGNLSSSKISCWFHVAKSWEPIRAQSVVPFNIATFKFIGEEFRGGQQCYKLRNQYTYQNKTSTYTLWVTKRRPPRPVRYEINGFNLLLNAPYDHYFIDYISFDEWQWDPNIMQIPKGSWCHKAANRTRSRYFTNPMAEFVHEDKTMHAKHERHVEHTFLNFKKKHGKSYGSVHEHDKRKNIFRHNIRFIQSKNRQGLNFTLAPNHLADLTDLEYQSLHGTFDTVNGDAWQEKDEQIPKRGEVPRIQFDFPDEPLPKNLDWREYGTVTPVRGQGQCGSCWAFSALAAVEGAYAIATDRLEEFSVQQLMDCTFGYDNYACRGGWPWKAMKWVKKNGVATTKSYGRYMAQEGFCHCGNDENCSLAHIESFGDVQRDNSTALKVALATYGPVSIAVNTDPKTFKFYSDGIYDDTSCSIITHHSVAAVGYGQTEDGQDFWIIKNSWNPFWGKAGFIQIAIKENICGVTHSNGVAVKFKHNKGKLPFKKMKRDPKDITSKFSKPKLVVEPLPFK